MFCTCQPSPSVLFAFSFFSAHLGSICWMTTPPILSTPLRTLVASSLTFFLFPTNFGPVAASLTAGFSSRSPGCLISKVPSLLPLLCPTQSLPLWYRLYLIRSLVLSRPPRQFRHRCFQARLLFRLRSSSTIDARFVAAFAFFLSPAFLLPS